MPLPDPLHYASLLLGGQQYDTIEFSSAGLSFARAAVEASELDVLQRGDECTATLCLGGNGWKEVYSVVLRLAARGPAHLGFAFVTLPPAARRLLEQPSTDPAGAALVDVAEPGWGGRPAPFSFARLAEREAPERRFILPESEPVFVHTQARHEANGLRPPARAEQSSPSLAASPPDVRRRRAQEAVLSSRALFACGIVLLAVAALCWAVVVA